MDNAGISLFQGNEINLSNAKQMEEDEEDLEEQRRRNEEVRNELKEIFHSRLFNKLISC